MHPKEAKVKLATAMVEEFSSQEEAREAREYFEKTFTRREDPDDVMEYRCNPSEPNSLTDILLKTHLVSSRNEARRLIREGGISHEGVKVESENWPVKNGLLKIGKRRFLKIVNG